MFNSQTASTILGTTAGTISTGALSFSYEDDNNIFLGAVSVAGGTITIGNGNGTLVAEGAGVPDDSYLYTAVPTFTVAGGVNQGGTIGGTLFPTILVLNGTPLITPTNFVTGTNGAEKLKGSYDSDGIEGLGGTDVIFGRSGMDEIFGDQRLFVLAGDGDKVTAIINGVDYTLRSPGEMETGNDRLYGGDGDDILHGGYGSDRLNGGDGDDILFATEGVVLQNVFGQTSFFFEEENDTGFDILFGGNGNDSLYGDAGRDILRGGEDDDHLSGKGGRDLLYGDNGDDSLYAGAGNDVLYGGDGNDILKGDAEAYMSLYVEASPSDTFTDVLYGGAGDDILQGGLDDDALYGGEGNDVFYYTKEMVLFQSTGQDIFFNIYTDLGTDRIKDFEYEGGDIIDIAGLLDNYNSLTDAIGDFVNLTTDGNDVLLNVDTDGSATNQSFETLAIIEGGIGGMSLDDLIDTGKLIVE